MVGQSDQLDQCTTVGPESDSCWLLDQGQIVGVRLDHQMKVGQLDWGQTIGPRLDSLTKARKLDWGWTIGPRSDSWMKVGQLDWGWTIRPRLDNWIEVRWSDQGQTIRPWSDSQTYGQHRTRVGPSNLGPMVMSLVPWYDSIPFYFCIFSISALMLTYYDAWYQHNASHKLCEPTWSLMLNAQFFV